MLVKSSKLVGDKIRVPQKRGLDQEKWALQTKMEWEFTDFQAVLEPVHCKKKYFQDLLTQHFLLSNQLNLLSWDNLLFWVSGD